MGPQLQKSLMSNNPISSLPQQNASNTASSQSSLPKRRSSAGGQVAGNRGDSHTPTQTSASQNVNQDHQHYQQNYQASSQKVLSRPHTANLASRSARNSNPNSNNRAQSTTSTDVYGNTERASTEQTTNISSNNVQLNRGHSSESATRKDYHHGNQYTQLPLKNHRSSFSTTAQKPPNFFSSKKSSLQRSNELRKSGIFQGPLTPTSNHSIKHSSSAKTIKCQGNSLGGKLKPSTPGAYLGSFTSTPLQYSSKAYIRNSHNDLQHHK